jgi:hypothetical protein
MRNFLFFIALMSQVAFASEALTTNSMTAVVSKVQEKVSSYGTENVVVVFDIDNTLLTAINDLGSDQWYSWQDGLMKDPNCKPTCVATESGKLLEAQALLYTIGKMKTTEVDLPTKIKTLQSMGVKIVLLTSRGTNVRNLTETALNTNGLNFAPSTIDVKNDVPADYLPYDLNDLSRSGLTAYDVKTAALGPARPVSFMNGVYMTSGQNKGIMLKVLLNKYGVNPKAIVYADDLQKHVDRMMAIMGNLTDLTTYRYGGVDENVKRFNEGDKTQVTTDWYKLQSTLKEIGF